MFSNFKSKKIFSDFNSGKPTSDASLPALREVDKQIGLTELLTRRIVDNRHPGYVKHSIHDMIRQKVYAIAADYEDLNDEDYDAGEWYKCAANQSNSRFLALQPSWSKTQTRPQSATELVGWGGQEAARCQGQSAQSYHQGPVRAYQRYRALYSAVGYRPENQHLSPGASQRHPARSADAFGQANPQRGFAANRDAAVGTVAVARSVQLDEGPRFLGWAVHLLWLWA
ncbi:MAG: transposase [Desulfobacteraceae bacterium]|nr:transposase [Desulfobacteraceae bacterium]